MSSAIEQNVSDVGDMASTANQFITAGVKTRDGQVIKRGVDLYKLLYPFQMVIAIVRYLVQEAKK